MEILQINDEIKFFVPSGELVIGLEYIRSSNESFIDDESIEASVIVGLPALIMFIVSTISAINNSDIRVSHHLDIESFLVAISDKLIKMKGVQ